MMGQQGLCMVLLCGARQAMVKRTNRIGAVIMEADGMAIGKMAKLLAKLLAGLLVSTSTNANPIEG